MLGTTGQEGDEVGDRIVQFVRKTIGAPSTP
jgi:hypothetical protein